MQAKPQGAEQLVEGMEVRDEVRRRSENTRKKQKGETRWEWGL